ncbi:MAG: glutaredoxin family protein [Methylophilaceae bacterium]
MHPQLILYGTAICHLCELAEAIVAPIAHKHRIQLSLVDIAEQSGLDAYETRIPVLGLEFREGLIELDWPFDAAAVTKLVSTKN